ncbi:hypothetical protein [Microbacterium sp. NIBRBAC000506063]|uniref:hypothetical protein n=1 Tax=Microbacterium sp. NIBRBAC000506063 TaxID=2734618 RepID=UPI001CB71DFF|nr:hypothetical protein [Microbacterium sp. NIBRBAC000506063]
MRDDGAEGGAQVRGIRPRPVSARRRLPARTRPDASTRAPSTFVPPTSTAMATRVTT